MSKLVQTEGYVLRIVPFQDNDLILTVLTVELGKISLFAKGARRPRSRFGPEIDLLSYSEFIILNSKNIKPLREATLKEYYPRLKENYDHLTSAMHGARLLSHLVREGQQDVNSMRLFSTFLQTLNQKEASVTLYELAYKLRLLDIFGIAPHLQNCTRCGKESARWWFSLDRGGVMCPDCHAASDIQLKSGIGHSLNALRTMNWEKLNRLRLNTKEMEFGNKLLDQFMAYHVQDMPSKAKH